MRPLDNPNDQPLTHEILEAFGFTYQDEQDAWLDEFGLLIYTNRLPETTMGLKRVMCGTAFRKGEDKAKNIVTKNVMAQLFALPVDNGYKGQPLNWDTRPQTDMHCGVEGTVY